MATNIKEWQKTAEMTLPSGNVVQLKRVGLMDLIAQGNIPDTLSGLATEVATKDKLRSLSAEELAEYVNIINLVVKACAVSPKIADAATEDTLAVTDIDFVDRVEIFSWANGVANSLRPFLGQPRRKARSFNAS